MVTLKYLGTLRRQIGWNSQARVYNFHLSPGDTITIPENQVRYAMGQAPFEIVRNRIYEVPKVENDAKPVIKVVNKKDRNTKENEVAMKIVEMAKSQMKPKEEKLSSNPLGLVETIEKRTEIQKVDEPLEEKEVVDDVEEVESFKGDFEKVDEPLEKKEVVEDVEDNTDFSAYNKDELVDWLVSNGVKRKPYKLKKKRKDTLISMCVNIQDKQ